MAYIYEEGLHVPDSNFYSDQHADRHSHRDSRHCQAMSITRLFSKPVPGVSLDAATASILQTLTDSSGNYVLGGFVPGPYTMTPSRTAQPCLDAPDGIFANDAALISRHVVGLITLTDDQLIAAKVTGDLTSEVSSLDAAFIAKRIVGNCNVNNHSGQWVFSPSSTVHPQGVNISLTENYKAYMLGDVTGDWDAAGESRVQGRSDAPATVSIPPMTAISGTEVLIPLRITNWRDGRSIRCSSMLFMIRAIIAPAPHAARVDGTVADGMNVTSNSPSAGLLKVVVYGAVPVSGDGIYVYLRFKVTGDAGSVTKLQIIAFRSNDGGDAVTVRDGLLTVRSVGLRRQVSP